MTDFIGAPENWPHGWINGKHATGASITYTVNNAGALIVVAVMYANAAGTYTISDGTTTYNVIVSSSNGSLSTTKIYAFIAASAGSVTITTNAPASTLNMIVDEFVGYGLTTDGTATATGSTSPVTSGNISTANAQDLIYAAIYSPGSSGNFRPYLQSYDPFSLGSAFNLNNSGTTAHREVDSTGSYGASIVATNLGSWAGAAVAFQASSAYAQALRGVQHAEEVVMEPTANLRVAAADTESAFDPSKQMRLAQAATEATSSGNQTVRIAHIGQEIIYPYVPSAVEAIQQFILPGG